MRGSTFAIRVVPLLFLAGFVGAAACTASDFYGVAEPDCEVDDDASAGIQGALTKTGGDNQTVAAGGTIAVSVNLVDVLPEALCHKTIQWTVTSGGGSVHASPDTTDIDGNASAVWTTGNGSSVQTLTATVKNSDPTLTVTFTANVTGTTGGGNHPVAEIGAYNGTSTAGVTFAMQTPYDGTHNYGPLGTNVEETAQLQVEVGAQFHITAHVGALSGTVTCTADQSIIPDPNDPNNTGSALVAVFEGEIAGTLALTCNGGWH
jgi:hypothetical protein